MVAARGRVEGRWRAGAARPMSATTTRCRYGSRWNVLGRRPARAARSSTPRRRQPAAIAPGEAAGSSGSRAARHRGQARPRVPTRRRTCSALSDGGGYQRGVACYRRALELAPRAARRTTTGNLYREMRRPGSRTAPRSLFPRMRVEPRQHLRDLGDADGARSSALIAPAHRGGRATWSTTLNRAPRLGNRRGAPRRSARTSRDCCRRPARRTRGRGFARAWATSRGLPPARGGHVLRAFARRARSRRSRSSDPAARRRSTEFIERRAEHFLPVSGVEPVHHPRRHRHPRRPHRSHGGQPRAGRLPQAGAGAAHVAESAPACRRWTTTDRHR